MKKKLLSVLLIGAMAATMVAGCGSKDENENSNNSVDNTEVTEAGGDEAVTYSNKQVIIGNTTESNGDIQPHWTNNASDYDAYKLVYGQSVVEGTADGEWVYNDTVVDNVEETENEDGTKTWTYTIKQGLTYSNGEEIKARDYCFYYAFWSNPVVQVDLEATNSATVGHYLLGYEAYAAGETNTLAGVHLVDDYTFSVTIDSQFLPYYYGKALAGPAPEYMYGWVPEDVELIETEDGVQFSDNFTAEHIKDTAEEYRYNPTACSGPYMFTSYDTNAACYTLTKNPNYPGNYEGQTANIETIIYQYVPQDTSLDQLKTGAIDLLLQCADGSEIETGLDMVDEGGFDYCSYPRAGYGQLVFKCNQGPTQFVEVRHAIAYLLDRNAFAQTFTGGHGTVVNGPYGLQQWMTEEYADEVDALNAYNYSLDAAVTELEEGGWVYNEDGSDYSGEGVRYKKLDDGTYMPLIIEWCSSENNSVSDLLVTSLQQNEDVATAGMQINQTVVTFPELLEAYYDTSEDCPYQMFNLGNGFSNPYDVAESYKPGSTENLSVIEDDELYSYAIGMNQTEEGDDEAYGEQWVSFMQRWNELLPELPLYSNIYHDFYTDRLHDYVSDGYNIDVTGAILYANIE